MEKVLTISIASYNIEKFLDRTVGSLICDQTHLDKLEIIIVDDGSKDQTSALARKWSQKYPNSIKVVTKENEGYGSTVNTSIEICQGKYFKLLDGDDAFVTDNLIGFIDFLEIAESDIVLSPYISRNVVTNEDKEIYSHKYITKKDTEINAITFTDPVVMHEIAVKSKVLKEQEYRLSEKVSYTDNEYVFICFMNAKNICRYDFPVYIYSIGVEGQSVSLEGERKHYKDNVVVAKKVIDIYESKKMKILNNSVINNKLELVINNVFSAYMVLESPEQKKKELILFDNYVKEKSRDAYALSNNIPKVKFLRLTHYMLYKYACKRVLKNTVNG